MFIRISKITSAAKASPAWPTRCTSKAAGGNAEKSSAAFRCRTCRRGFGTGSSTARSATDDARKKPNELIFASSGLHGALHLPAALFLKAAGLQMKHLPTQGGGPSITALLGNNSQVAVSSLAAASAQVKAGKARILACFSAMRLATHPEVPTMKESGYDVEFYLWTGLFAPKGTPQPIIDRIRTEAKKAVAAETFVQAMKNLSEEIAFLDQPEFKTFWDADARRVEEAVRLIGKV